MSENLCFCHFNGYEVKDATARKSIEKVISDLPELAPYKIAELNKGGILTFWVGTQAEYDAIQTRENNCFYIVTDDATTKEIKDNIIKILSDITGIKSDITGIKSDITGIKSDITGIQTDIETVEARDFITEQGTAEIASSNANFPDITWYFRKWNSGVVEMFGKTSVMELGSYKYWTLNLPITLIEKPIFITYGFDALSDAITESNAESYQLRAITKFSRAGSICVFVGNTGTKLDEAQVMINVIGKWK